MNRTECLPQPVKRRKAKGIRETDRIALYIGIAIQVLTVTDGTGQDVLIDKPLDLRVVVALTHIEKRVIISDYAKFTL